ncbi:MAG: hypothetical protein PHV09_03835 [Bacteroidales bacterium]|nr:hypothetical protein [Bacteroidales bacterium]
MKTLDLKKIFRLYLPSVVFAGVFATYAIVSNMTLVNIIAGSIALLIIVNLFIQSLLLSRILGTIFLLGSFYMILALLDDIADGEATIEYLFGFLMILFSIAMSVLLIIGYNKKSNIEFLEQL